MRKKNYFSPRLVDLYVKLERGFESSEESDWGDGTPGGTIGENDYNYEL